MSLGRMGESNPSPPTHAAQSIARLVPATAPELKPISENESGPLTSSLRVHGPDYSIARLPITDLNDTVADGDSGCQSHPVPEQPSETQLCSREARCIHLLSAYWLNAGARAGNYAHQ